MDDTPGRGAYRCLPLNLANQAGWMIRSPFRFSATWNGGITAEDIDLDFEGNDSQEKASESVLSHFGNGIVTFRIPFLFRTPPGVGLLVRGTPNWPVSNFASLEGLVETDWNPASFTMNWKVMEPDRPVVFEKEWPVCFLQPFQLDLPECLEAHRGPLEENPNENEDYLAWRESRGSFLESGEVERGGWQGDYFRGMGPGEKKVESHRTAFDLSEFEMEE